VSFVTNNTRPCPGHGENKRTIISFSRATLPNNIYYRCRPGVRLIFEVYLRGDDGWQNGRKADGRDNSRPYCYVADDLFGLHARSVQTYKRRTNVEGDDENSVFVIKPIRCGPTGLPFPYGLYDLKLNRPSFREYTRTFFAGIYDALHYSCITRIRPLNPNRVITNSHTRSR